MALIKCPECGATISDKAECCPTCGCPKTEFTVERDKQNGKDENIISSEPIENVVNNSNSENPAKSDEKQAQAEKVTSQDGCIAGLLVGLAFFLFAVIMIISFRSCGGGNVERTSGVDSDSIVVDTVSVDSTAIPVEEEIWSYSEDKDELTGKTTYFAQAVSENYTTFDFPYNHTPIYLTLNIRKSPRYGTDVYLTIPEGQFHTNYDGTYISVRFDNGSVARYSCSEPSDNSSTVLFINGAKGFIKKLKSSKECRISAEFYQNGSPTFTFKTEGLKWNH